MWNFLTLSYGLIFDGHWSSASEDKTCEWVLVIAHHYRGKFGDHRHCGSEDIMALVLSRDHARTYDQMVI